MSDELAEKRLPITRHYRRLSSKRGAKLVAGAAIVLVLLLVPASLLESLPSICLVRNATGWECPGCGMTRAIVSLLHGDLLSALHYNRAVVVIFPLLCYLSLKKVTSDE